MSSIVLHGREEAKRKIIAASNFLFRRRHLEIAGEMVLDKALESFRTGRNPSGARWKRLSKNTVTARRGGSSKPLQDTGLLRGSLHRGGTDSIWRYRGAESLVVGSSEKKAVWHNLGTKPYRIKPKSASMLRFAVASGGHGKRAGGGFWAFAREISHPGLPARTFLGVTRRMADEIAAATGIQIDTAFATGRAR